MAECLHVILCHVAEQPHTAALLYVDDQLPIRSEDPTVTTYFTDDILASADLRARGYGRDHCFSPNVKASVVRDLRNRGLVNVDHTCMCIFLQRHTDVRFVMSYHNGRLPSRQSHSRLLWWAGARVFGRLGQACG